MNKKAWFVVILVLGVLGYFVALKLIPGLDEWVHTSISLPLSTAIANGLEGLKASPLWIETIAPNDWIISGVAGIIGTIFFYRYMITHTLPWRRTTTPTPEYQHQPQSAPQAIPINIKVQTESGKTNPEPKTKKEAEVEAE